MSFADANGLMLSFRRCARAFIPHKILRAVAIRKSPLYQISRVLPRGFSYSSNMPSSKNKYTDPRLRDEVKEEIQESDKGGARGQWSARKVCSSVHMRLGCWG